MKILSSILFVVIFSINMKSQSNSGAICLPPNQSNGLSENWVASNSRSVNDLKIVRVNIHFNLTGNGTGNFRANDDGLGNTNYTGYDFARRLIEMCNWWNQNNEIANIPLTNKPSADQKNIRWVLDAVIFRNNQTYYPYNSNNAATDHTLHGIDVLNVMNNYLRGGQPKPTGNASNTSSTSSTKYTSNGGYWEGYQALINGGGSITDSWWHSYVVHLNHELFHCHTLNHTVRYNWNSNCFSNCPTGCGTILCPNVPVDSLCDDFCGDTPSAWEIAQANGCTKHPNCGWGEGNLQWCSNNVMDYTGGNSMTPCQINRIHSALEGGLRPYLACNAVLSDLSLCDIGYPKLSYFGKDVSIGCPTSAANLTSKEKIDVYTSNFVELTNFEVAADAAFEVYHLPVCGF